MDFIIKNYDSILLVLVFIVLLIILYKRGKEKELNTILLNLVLRAEYMFAGSTGELKRAEVASWIYERIPAILRWIFTEKEISDMIEDAVIYMKQFLEARRMIYYDGAELSDKEIVRDLYEDK